MPPLTVVQWGNVTKYIYLSIYSSIFSATSQRQLLPFRLRLSDSFSYFFDDSFSQYLQNDFLCVNVLSIFLLVETILQLLQQQTYDDLMKYDALLYIKQTNSTVYKVVE